LPVIAVSAELIDAALLPDLRHGVRAERLSQLRAGNRLVRRIPIHDFNCAASPARIFRPGLLLRM